MSSLISNLTGPDYYRRGRIQVWDFIRDQNLNFHLGNAIKYICRAGHKESRIKDLQKAIHYLQNELEHAEAESAAAGRQRVPRQIRPDSWSLFPIFDAAGSADS